ncbi:mitochondrial ribonuclease P protein 1 homolog [Amyelois transitella]|uniref:mitochondrial ribonuclease P protein 1 homolog n=1 Tax=Amyelois transitella TaxID=680683 RepID=UPI00298FBCA6|nr:mitochondrial ribonuclease P protein 1 homolog [Amyelois transitella]
MFCVRAFINQLKSPRSVKAYTNGVKIKSASITQHTFYSIKVKDDTDQLIDELCNKDPKLEKKLRILMLEVEVMRQDGRLAPSFLKNQHWKHLMLLESRNQRIKYLTYLWKTEKTKENTKAKKEARKKELETTSPEETKEFPDDLLYGIKYRSLFLRIRDQSINNFDNYKALQAMIHGRPLIVDCSYENYMVHREILNAAKQMTYVFGDNRIHKDPFDLHLCNVNLEGSFMEQLKRNIPSLDEPWFPMNIHTESYLDIFPKEKLVYLTPHCREEFTGYDYDSIYIVGCMVDKINNEPLSLAKAKKDGLKMAKLPLDRYLEWAPGSKKNLNINHMIPILLDLKLTSDWEYALRHIPRRKLLETKILAMQKKLRNPELKNEVIKNFKKYANLGPMKHNPLAPFKDRKSKSRKSLYDDDSI